MRLKGSNSWSIRHWAQASICLAVLLSASAAAAGDVTVPGIADFPESMTGTPDGTLYFSSFGGGRVLRSEPGAGEAQEFIKQGASGLSSTLGVLADPKTDTLFVCSDDFSGAGIAIPGSDGVTALKLFDLKTGALKTSLPLPGKPALCNDIVVSADGTAYVTNSLGGAILSLKPGGDKLEVWAHDARWDVRGKAQLDGIAILGDAVYTNLFEGDGLYRVKMKPDGSAGEITKLKTSRSIYHSDGLRAYGDKLLMVEGETKGFLDLITLSGDDADIATLKDGFEGPVSLWQIGDILYVLDSPLKYLFNPALKGKGPSAKASAIKLP